MAVSKGTGLTPKQHAPSGSPVREVGRGDDGMYFFGAGGVIELVRTLVPIAVNASKKLKLTDAAAGTFLHEGRIADLRCIGKQDQRT